jgi:hypothetical protein
VFTPSQCPSFVLISLLIIELRLRLHLTTDPWSLIPLVSILSPLPFQLSTSYTFTLSLCLREASNRSNGFPRT